MFACRGFCMSDATAISRRLAFATIDRATIDTLKAHKSFVMNALPGVLDDFYAHVGRFEESARFFRNREHMMHAKEMQLRHWDIIAEGRFDESYERSVTKIGEAHHRLGLEPRWYIGGYNFLLARLVTVVMQSLPGGVFDRGLNDRKAQLQAALVKASLLDMDYAIAVYLDEGRRERETTLNRLVGELESAVGSITANVSSAAKQLQAEAQTMTAGAEETSAQAAVVSQASETASANVQTVAAATEELASSVKEIARQVIDSAKITNEAVRTAKETASNVHRLSEEATRIDDILKLMQEEEASSLYDFAGISEEENVMDPGLTKVKLRYKWLIINLVTAFLA